MQPTQTHALLSAILQEYALRRVFYQLARGDGGENSGASRRCVDGRQHRTQREALFSGSFLKSRRTIKNHDDTALLGAGPSW